MIFFLCLGVIPGSAFSATGASGNWTYGIHPDGTVEIFSFSAPNIAKEIITIPKTLDGRTVSSVRSTILWNGTVTYLKKLYVPDTAECDFTSGALGGDFEIIYYSTSPSPEESTDSIPRNFSDHGYPGFSFDIQAIYDGAPPCLPTAAVTVTSQKGNVLLLEEGVDYTVAYSNLTNPQISGTAVFTGIGAFYGTCGVTYYFDVISEVSETPSVPGITNSERMLAAGKNYVIALNHDGTAWTWGENTFGILGAGEEVDFSAFPVQIKHTYGGLYLYDVVAVAADDYQTAFLRKDGTVWEPGKYDFHKIEGFSDSIDIAAGGGCIYTLKKDGTVWSRGDNSKGQLGVGNHIGYSSVPVQVQGLTDVAALSSTGDTHMAVLKTDGTVWGWGSNYYHQLNSDGEIYYTPILLTQFADVAKLAAGGGRIAVLKNDGSVWACGNNIGSEPQQIVDSGAVAVAVDTYLVVLKADGTVLAWSYYYNTGHTYEWASYLSGIVAIATEDENVVALKHDGTVWTMGDNTYGQLGNGATNESLSPVQVQGTNTEEDLNLLKRTQAPGDLNADESVNNRDLTLLLRYLAEWDSTRALSSLFADLNQDNLVDNRDLTLLLRFLAGWENIVLL